MRWLWSSKRDKSRFVHIFLPFTDFSDCALIVANRLRKMANSYDQVYHTVSVNLILVFQCRHRATRSITVWQSIALNPSYISFLRFAVTHLCPSVERRGGRRKCLGQEHILRTSMGLLITSFSSTSYPRYIQVGSSIVAEFPLRFLWLKLFNWWKNQLNFSVEIKDVYGRNKHRSTCI